MLFEDSAFVEDSINQKDEFIQRIEYEKFEIDRLQNILSDALESFSSTNEKKHALNYHDQNQRLDCHGASVEVGGFFMRCKDELNSMKKLMDRIQNS